MKCARKSEVQQTGTLCDIFSWQVASNWRSILSRHHQTLKKTNILCMIVINAYISTLKWNKKADNISEICQAKGFWSHGTMQGCSREPHSTCPSTGYSPKSNRMSWNEENLARSLVEKPAWRKTQRWPACFHRFSWHLPIQSNVCMFQDCKRWILDLLIAINQPRKLIVGYCGTQPSSHLWES